MRRDIRIMAEELAAVSQNIGAVFKKVSPPPTAPGLAATPSQRSQARDRMRVAQPLTAVMPRRAPTGHRKATAQESV